MPLLVISDVDERNLLAFDLCDLLEVLGDEAINATWEVVDVECVGPGADEMHALSDSDAAVSGELLATVAARVHQVIDGCFAARRSDSSMPFVVLTAVDSTCWDIESSDETILVRFERRFSQTRRVRYEDA